MIDADGLKEEIVPPCCDLSAAAVDSYSPQGGALIRTFLPDACTVLVLGHHITTSLEWAWLPFVTERGGNTCVADLHAKSTVEAIERRLLTEGYRSLILPYPGGCGISFKRLAARTSMGELGDSFLFLHHTWGPWVHLRVLLTDGIVADDKVTTREVCTHCGKCIEACRGKALSPGNHDQQACGRWQQRLRDDSPIKAGYRHKCEVCVRVCPVTEAPQELVIRDTGSLRP